MGEETATRHRVDAEGLVGADELKPIDFLHFLVEFLRGFGKEVFERFQHLEGGTYLVINAVHQFLIAFAEHGTVHAAHVFGSQSLDFFGQHLFESGSGFGY